MNQPPLPVGQPPNQVQGNQIIPLPNIPQQPQNPNGLAGGQLYVNNIAQQHNIVLTPNQLKIVN